MGERFGDALTRLFTPDREDAERHLVRDGAVVIAMVFGGGYAALLALAALL